MAFTGDILFRMKNLPAGFTAPALVHTSFASSKPPQTNLVETIEQSAVGNTDLVATYNAIVSNLQAGLLTTAFTDYDSTNKTVKGRIVIIDIKIEDKINNPVNIKVHYELLVEIS